jgi:hypothetical protein
MTVYVAILQENDWETEPFNIGVYSSREKAEAGLVNALRERGETVLSLEIYDASKDPYYTYFIEEYELDK